MMSYKERLNSVGSRELVNTVVIFSLALCLDPDKYNVHKYERICQSRYFIMKIAFILQKKKRSHNWSHLTSHN